MYMHINLSISLIECLMESIGLEHAIRRHARSVWLRFFIIIVSSSFCFSSFKSIGVTRIKGALCDVGHTFQGLND